MIPDIDVLPCSLRKVSKTSGLLYLTHTGGRIAPYPVACRELPLYKDPLAAVDSLPIQMNFVREEFDMDKKENREEYNRIMTYYKSNYGMQILYLDRKFVKKTKTVNGEKKQKMVQRIFIEYYAPYRILNGGQG